MVIPCKIGYTCPKLGCALFKKIGAQIEITRVEHFNFFKFEQGLLLPLATFRFKIFVCYNNVGNVYCLLQFKTSHLLDERQHGFLSQKSCTTNMLYFSDNVVMSINDCNTMSTDVVYFDFSKAFDSVNHDLILHKLLWWALTGW